MILEDLRVEDIVDSYPGEVYLSLNDEVWGLNQYMDSVRKELGFRAFYDGPDAELDFNGWYHFGAVVKQNDDGKTVEVYCNVCNGMDEDGEEEYEIPAEAFGVSDIDIINYLDCQCVIVWDVTIDDLMKEEN